MKFYSLEHYCQVRGARAGQKFHTGGNQQQEVHDVQDQEEAQTINEGWCHLHSEANRAAVITIVLLNSILKYHPYY